MKIFLKKISGIVLSLILISMLSIPGTILAQDTKPNTSTKTNISDIKTIENFQVFKVLQVEGQTDPKKNFSKDIPFIASVILAIIDFLLRIIGSLSFLIFVLGGIILVTSQGQESRLESGKTMMTYAVLGIIITFSSYAIATFVQSLIAR